MPWKIDASPTRLVCGAVPDKGSRLQDQQPRLQNICPVTAPRSIEGAGWLSERRGDTAKRNQLAADLRADADKLKNPAIRC
jgi:hypothetical protein